MNTKKLFSTLLILLLTITPLFTGCEKKTEVTPSSKTNKLIAEFHNKWLGEIMTKHDKTKITVDYFFDNIAPLILDDYYSRNPNLERISADEINIKYRLPLKNFIEDSSGDYVEEMIARNIINSDNMQIVFDIKDIMNNGNKTNEEKRISIKDIEVNIENSLENYTEEEASALLGYTSVAIASSYYWENYYNYEKTNWWHVVGADAIGALVGFLDGGPLGAIFWSVFISTAEYIAEN